MGTNNENILKSWPVLLVLLLLIVAATWFYTNNKMVTEPDVPTMYHSEQSLERSLHTEDDHSQHTEQNAPAESSHSRTEFGPTVSAARKLSQADAHDHGVYSLATIAKYARSWSPGFTQWYGKPAPDLSFLDVHGKTHKLSEYKGKDIIVIFWATWCPPCKAEIPHLIELRNQKSTDELAIIAISSENYNLVKRFAAENKLNYTVGGLLTAPPKPFADVTVLPTSFYIDKQHNFKIATKGAVSMAETLAILKAEE